MDAHVHSKASDGPVIAAAGFIGCPECYSEPEAIYDTARARGMDLVTITDHDTVKGAWSLVERGYDRFIAGEEVTVLFPEDRCKLHVLVWDMTPELDDELRSENLRADVYRFAAWLKDRDLPHALAHPLYIQNGRLTRWHVERAALLFKGFECLNGAHQGRAKGTIERFIARLTPEYCAELAREHDLKPVWPEPWNKGRTGGSDDHAMLNVGRTYTEMPPGPDGATLTDPRAFVRGVLDGHGDSAGVGGHSSLLAHQIATVGMNYYARQMHPNATPTGKLVGRKLLRFAGIDLPKPSKPRLAAHLVRKRVLRPRKRRSPMIAALRETIGPILDRYPDLRARLDRDTWPDAGTAIGEHERMAALADDLSRALTEALTSRGARALRKHDKQGVLDAVLAAGLVQLAQVPYIFSLFHQNKERVFLDRLDHELSAEDQGPSPLERPMRVSLFTDTLGDINGVCRFIQNVAEMARDTGRDLQVITSTRLTVPDESNIFNFKPLFAGSMPKYDNLEFVVPPLVEMLRHLDRHQPDVLHISTPGPVGLVGYLAARMLKIPVLGVYHTDFPAYIDHLFEDAAFTYMCRRYMQFFYKPFSNIFTRSEDYVEALEQLGMQRDRCTALLPGVDTETFHTRFEDPTVWGRMGVDPDAVKVLYVGRVSVEKNLPMLAGVWKDASRRFKELGLNAQLVVVGDGPYRPTMERELNSVKFLGFRHGDELSSIYASADMFVFPSITDTLGQVVMESQASGLPVLVTDQGGPKEVVTEGETGFVLPADRPDLWIDRLVQLVRDQGTRQRMGDAAHRAMQPYALSNSFDHFWSVHTDAWHAHLARLGIRPHAAIAASPSTP